MYGHTGKDYRVAILLKSYPNYFRNQFTMQSLKLKVQF